MDILRVTGLTALLAFVTAHSVQSLVGQLNAIETPTSITSAYIEEHETIILKKGRSYTLEKGACGSSGNRVPILHSTLQNTAIELFVQGYTEDGPFFSPTLDVKVASDSIFSQFTFDDAHDYLISLITSDRDVELSCTEGLRTVSLQPTIVNPPPAQNAPENIGNPCKEEIDEQNIAFRSGDGGCALPLYGTVWSAVAEHAMPYADAVSYCANLTEGGRSDWRLPTISETHRLVGFPGIGLDSLQPHAFTYINWPVYGIWSTDVAPNANSRYMVFLGSSQPLRPQNEINTIHTACVADLRDPPSPPFEPILDDSPFQTNDSLIPTLPTTSVDTPPPESATTASTEYLCDREFGPLENQNGLCVDNRTNRAWSAPLEGMHTLSSATTLCENLNVGGVDTWKLPSMIELQQVNRDNLPGRWPGSIWTRSTDYWQTGNPVIFNVTNYGSNYKGSNENTEARVICVAQISEPEDFWWDGGCWPCLEKSSTCEALGRVCVVNSYILSHRASCADPNAIPQTYSVCDLSQRVLPSEPVTGCPGQCTDSRWWLDTVEIDMDNSGNLKTVSRRIDTGDWYVIPSTDNYIALPENKVGSWSTETSWSSIFVYDINNDDLNDIIGYSREDTGWFAALSNGTTFDTVELTIDDSDIRCMGCASRVNSPCDGDRVCHSSSNGWGCFEPGAAPERYSICGDSALPEPILGIPPPEPNQPTPCTSNGMCGEHEVCTVESRGHCNTAPGCDPNDSCADVCYGYCEPVHGSRQPISAADCPQLCEPCEDGTACAIYVGSDDIEVACPVLSAHSQLPNEWISCLEQDEAVVLTVEGDFDGDGSEEFMDLYTSGRWINRDNGTYWGDWQIVDWNDVVVLDVNGDGLDDIAGNDSSTSAGADNWWVARSTGTAFDVRSFGSFEKDGEYTWINTQAYDIDNNDFDDIIVQHPVSNYWYVYLSGGNGFTRRELGPHWNVGDPLPSQFLLTVSGDFDGDGTLELMDLHNDGSWMLRGTDEIWGEWEPYVDWQFAVPIDVNGDGYDDIAAIDRSTSPTADNWWVAASNGSAFENLSFGSFNNGAELAWENVNVQDIDENGFEDIAVLHPETGEELGYFSGGQGFTLKSVDTEPTDTGDDEPIIIVPGDGTNNTPLVTLTGDFDGDDVPDLATLTVEGIWLANGGIFGAWAIGEWENVVIADVNGDGKDDVIGNRAGNWWVGISDGTRFHNTPFGSFSDTVYWQVVTMGPWDAGFSGTPGIYVYDINNDDNEDLIVKTDDNTWHVLRSSGTQFIKNAYSFGHCAGSSCFVVNDGYCSPEEQEITNSEDCPLEPDEPIAACGDGILQENEQCEPSIGCGGIDYTCTASCTCELNEYIFAGEGTFHPDVEGTAVLLTTGDWYIDQLEPSQDGHGKWASVDWEYIHVLDVDGDGYDEIVGRASGSWWMAKSDGTKFVSTPFGAGGDVYDFAVIGSLDFNGDGKEDLVGQTTGGLWVVEVSIGSRFIAAEFGPVGTLWDVAIGIFGADDTGDGIDEIHGQRNGTDVVGVRNGAIITTHNRSDLVPVTDVCAPCTNYDCGTQSLCTVRPESNEIGCTFNPAPVIGDGWQVCDYQPNDAANYCSACNGACASNEYCTANKADPSQTRCTPWGNAAQTGNWVYCSSATPRVDTVTTQPVQTDIAWLNIFELDMNDDGITEVVARHPDTGEWHRTNSLQSLQVLEPSSTSYVGRWALVDWQNVSVLDVNCDRFDDIIGSANGSWWIAISTGVGFTNISSPSGRPQANCAAPVQQEEPLQPSAPVEPEVPDVPTEPVEPVSTVTPTEPINTGTSPASVSTRSLLGPSQLFCQACANMQCGIGQVCAVNRSGLSQPFCVSQHNTGNSSYQVCEPDIIQIAACGNARMDTGEECDPAHPLIGEFCNQDCTLTEVELENRRAFSLLRPRTWFAGTDDSQCGNGSLNALEQCDFMHPKMSRFCTDDCTYKNEFRSFFTTLHQNRRVDRPWEQCDTRMSATEAMIALPSYIAASCRRLNSCTALMLLDAEQSGEQIDWLDMCTSASSGGSARPSGGTTTTTTSPTQATTQPNTAQPNTNPTTNQPSTTPTQPTTQQTSNAAGCGSNNESVVFSPGQQKTFPIRMKNTGTSTWDISALSGKVWARVGAPQGWTRVGSSFTANPDKTEVSPNQEVAFQVSIKAPIDPGGCTYSASDATYTCTMSFGMGYWGGNAFGDTCSTQLIIELPNTATPSNTTTNDNDDGSQQNQNVTEQLGAQCVSIAFQNNANFQYTPDGHTTAKIRMKNTGTAPWVVPRHSCTSCATNNIAMQAPAYVPGQLQFNGIQTLVFDAQGNAVQTGDETVVVPPQGTAEFWANAYMPQNYAQFCPLQNGVPTCTYTWRMQHGTRIEASSTNEGRIVQSAFGDTCSVDLYVR